MATTLDTTLEEKVSKLEEKSERIRSEKNVESRLESVTNSIDRLNSDIRSVEETADELAFYVDVLETVFDGDRPEVVESAISDAHEAIDIDEETVVVAAERQEFSELFDTVETAEERLRNVIDVVDDRITNEHQSPREEELDSAKELNKIIGGGDDEFLDLIASMETFLNQAIWQTRNDPRTLSARWDRLNEQWRENTGKHGWESFQREHELADDTIDELKKFTTKDTVRLSDLSMTTLREIKQVDELESALQVKLKSR